MLEKKQWKAGLDTTQKALYYLSNNFSESKWEANPTIQSSNTKLELLNTLALKAKLLNKFYQEKQSIELLQNSLATYQKTIELIQTLRSEYSGDQSKEFLSAQSFHIFEQALSVATQLYRLTKKAEYLEYAFTFCEVSKALSLFENLKDMEAKEFSNLPESLIEQEQQLKIQIAQLELQLSNLGESERKTEVQDLLFSVKEQYRQLIALFKSDYSDYYNLKYDITTISLETLQASLSEKETLVEYFYGENNIYVFTICLLYTSPSPRDATLSRMPSSA